LGDDVDTKHSVRGDVVEVEAPDEEENGKGDEAGHLDGLSSNSVDKCNGAPVTRDGTSADKNRVTSTQVVEGLINIVSGGVSDRSQDGGGVQSQTVEGNVKHEPRTGSAQKDTEVPPLAVIVAEVAEAGLRDGELLRGTERLNSADLVRVAVGLASHVGLHILAGLLDITSNIEGVTRRLGNRETVVEGDAGRDSAEADEDTPHLVNRELADTGASSVAGGSKEGLLETSSNDKHDEGTAKLAKTLHGKHGTHHGSSPLGCGKLRRDNGAERIVTTNSCVTVSTWQFQSSSWQ
jgi:hypothetical protein